MTKRILRSLFLTGGLLALVMGGSLAAQDAANQTKEESFAQKLWTYPENGSYPLPIGFCLRWPGGRSTIYKSGKRRFWRFRPWRCTISSAGRSAQRPKHSEREVHRNESESVRAADFFVRGVACLIGDGRANQVEASLPGGNQRRQRPVSSAVAQ